MHSVCFLRKKKKERKRNAELCWGCLICIVCVFVCMYVCMREGGREGGREEGRKGGREREGERGGKLNHLRRCVHASGHTGRQRPGTNSQKSVP